MKKQPDKSKRPRGRPIKYPMPDSIPDTPENVMKVDEALQIEARQNAFALRNTGSHKH